MSEADGTIGPHLGRDVEGRAVVEVGDVGLAGVQGGGQTKVGHLARARRVRGAHMSHM